ncbi:uncharacterized protein BCR38DRAFT_484842 [Pseudomassariella vexata]|uniref:GPI anchored protein n=1 Tax=Pseudomassariella vexata TaxID=1141098 RepID=A0A1Y2E1J2_9PEZI|nr:uncharacterized protein BCR38DRAFT_484842 [Pseudomassariella vexata]ORY65418.1 hypothetical protein BCR38DRAFT_484842 [Pseudomassariella vexata]
MKSFTPLIFAAVAMAQTTTIGVTGSASLTTSSFSSTSSFATLSNCVIDAGSQGTFTLPTGQCTVTSSTDSSSSTSTTSTLNDVPPTTQITGQATTTQADGTAGGASDPQATSPVEAGAAALGVNGLLALAGVAIVYAL